MKRSESDSNLKNIKYKIKLEACIACPHSEPKHKGTIAIVYRRV